MDRKIGKKYLIQKKIGGGSFGEIFLGNHIITKEEVAIKLEPTTQRPAQLLNEVQIYKKLSLGVGFPQVKWNGLEGSYNVLVLDLLGQSLGDLLKSNGNKFPLRTVLIIADQLLSRLEYIHEKGFLHRDIKPENFVLGIGTNKNTIYVIDFGISCSYINYQTKTHIPFKEGRPFNGTARYSSINSHFGIESSRRDDLESLAYLLIYFLKGSLPWQGIKEDNKNSKQDQIGLLKKSIPIDELCLNIPSEFLTFLHEIRRLEFTDKPNYSLYRDFFRNLFIREGFIYGNLFEVSKTLSNELFQNNNLNRSKNSLYNTIPIFPENSPIRNYKRIKIPQLITSPQIKQSRRLSIL